MSAVLEQPVRTITDPTAGIELVSGDIVDLRAPRHLFLAANLLDPARQRDIGLLDGGEELENRCLRRTSGKLPKCEITPLEWWVEWIPMDLFPEGMEHLALSLKDTGQPEGSGNRIFKPLYGYPYYPAYAIIDAIGLASGESKGVVEIENLRGVEYGKADRELQDLFFPVDYAKPVELRLIGQHIEQVAESVADPDAKDTAAFMLASVAQSTEYLGKVVSIAQTQLNQRVISGPGFHYTYSLTPKIRSFMAQLEVRPEAGVQVREAVNQAVTASLPPEVIEQLASQSEALRNIGPAIAEAVKDAIAAALAANKPSAKTKPSE